MQLELFCTQFKKLKNFATIIDQDIIKKIKELEEYENKSVIEFKVDFVNKL